MNKSGQRQEKVVITGGPSTGKTSLIQELEAAGQYCFHEVIRLMTLEAKNNGEITDFSTNPIAMVQDPMDFNRRILEARMQHFQEAGALDESTVFFDRGLPDVLAYMDYFGQEYGPEFTEIMETHRYDTVFLLPVWKDIYVADNERFESYDEAMALHEHLWEAYTRFGYTVVAVPKDTIPNRLRFITKKLKL